MSKEGVNRLARAALAAEYDACGHSREADCLRRGELYDGKANLHKQRAIRALEKTLIFRAEGKETIFDHCWLDPACVEQGCKSLFLRQATALLKSLVLMARTAGGTAGPDSGLMKACDEAEAFLEGRAPGMHALAFDREDRLSTIAAIVQNWMYWIERRDGLQPAADAVLMLPGANAPPVWPTYSQLGAWLDALRG